LIINFYIDFLGSELSEKTVRSRISEAFEKVRGVSLAREELQMFRYIWRKKARFQRCFTGLENIWKKIFKV